MREAPIAWGMSSLNLFVVGDEGVIITGLLEAGFDIQLRPGEVYALVSPDLETWSTASWGMSGLDDQENLVDPSLSWSPRGELQMVYYATTFQAGDPVYYAGDHKIRRSVWQGDAFTADLHDLYAEEGLADPVTCRIGTTEWLFATRGAEEVRAAIRENGAETFTRVDTFSWQDRTVPWCREDADGITLYSQTTEPPMSAYEGFLDEDGIFQELGEFYANSPFGGEICASLGVARFRDTWLLVCVETNH